MTRGVSAWTCFLLVARAGGQCIEVKASDDGNYSYVCILLADSSVYCATNNGDTAGTVLFNPSTEPIGGFAGYSTLSSGKWDNLSTPEVKENVRLTSIAVGAAWVCGLKAEDNMVKCWEFEYWGKYPKSNFAFTAPSTGTQRFKSIQADGNALCGHSVPDGLVVCFQTKDDLKFSDVPAGGALDNFTMSDEIACGTRSSDKNVVCWGHMQGASTMTSCCSPPSPRSGYIGLTSAYTVDCGITPDGGTVSCWNGHFASYANRFQCTTTTTTTITSSTSTAFTITTTKTSSAETLPTASSTARAITLTSASRASNESADFGYSKLICIRLYVCWSIVFVTSCSSPRREHSVQA
eukprot:TRINITY_DN103180_c0_g1_i1.p1 TRINITY_DN103180_c0_g1~~TRINITY_DN103180_c0_g1_i1.p1  ORF type:complete len:351 (+),score=25.75 TRINITY_DN103180_c0_g1_i1:51-1103(+)